MIFNCLTVFTILFLYSFNAFAGENEGIEALQKGDYKMAYKEFLPLAKAGDEKSMITLGLLFHEGKGFEQNYSTAMEWYIKAFRLGNGDAYNNIGVMYRDGLGVTKNRQIAYCLFLITHMRSLGTQDTQLRANRNLRRLITELSEDEIKQALCYTEEYVQEYVYSKGKINNISENFIPSLKTPAIKDKDWWIPGELLDFECQ